MKNAVWFVILFGFIVSFIGCEEKKADKEKLIKAIELMSKSVIDECEKGKANKETNTNVTELTKQSVIEAGFKDEKEMKEVMLKYKDDPEIQTMQKKSTQLIRDCFSKK